MLAAIGVQNALIEALEKCDFWRNDLDEELVRNFRLKSHGLAHSYFLSNL